MHANYSTSSLVILTCMHGLPASTQYMVLPSEHVLAIAHVHDGEWACMVTKISVVNLAELAGMTFWL